MTPDDIKKLLADAEFQSLSVPQQEAILRQGGAPVDDEFRAMLQHLKGNATPGQAALGATAQAAGEHVATHPFQTAALAGNFLPGVGLLGGAALNMAGGLADQALGFNPKGIAEAGRSLPSTLGMALAQRLMPPGVAPLAQGLGMGAGGFLGEGMAQGSGMVDPNPAMLAVSGILPAAAGAAVNTVTGIGKAGARMVPGANPAMQEAALEEALGYPNSLAPPKPAKDLYNALAQQTGEVMVPTPNLAAARTMHWQRELEMAKYSPESVDDAIAAATGSQTIQALRAQQPQLISAADKKRLAVMNAELAVEEADARLNDLIAQQRSGTAFQGNYGNPVPAIARARKRYDLAVERLQQFREDHTALTTAYDESVRDLGDLFTGGDVPFEALQDQLRRQNARYVAAAARNDAGKGGEYLGAVKNIRKAIKTDMEAQTQLYPQLQEANHAFQRELAVDYLKEEALTTLSDMQGVTGVNAQTLATKVKRTLADADGPLSSLSKDEARAVESFYSDLSRRFAPSNNLMMGMIWTGIGSGLGHQAFGDMGAGSFALGGIAGLVLSNSLARLAIGSPRWRKTFIALLDAGRGRISQDTLESLAQLASQETSRAASREEDSVEVSLAPQGSLFMNARKPQPENFLQAFSSMQPGL